MEKGLEDLKKKLALIQSSLTCIDAGLPQVVSFVLLENYAETIGPELKQIVEKHRPKS